MVDIPEHLLLRSAEARAKALGISVEQALAEMKGESNPTVVAEEPEVVEIMAKESPNRVTEIDEWGANFAKLKNGKIYICYNLN